MSSVSASGVLQISEIISVVILLFADFTFSLAWKAADNKEKYGKPILKAVLFPIAVLTLAIGIIGAISYVKKESEAGGKRKFCAGAK